jgi:hypothetical protein
MAYVPTKVWKGRPGQIWEYDPDGGVPMVWGRRPSVTFDEYSEAFVREMYRDMGSTPIPPPLKIPSMFWECAGFWFVVIGLYGLAYMTWGM